MNGKSRLKVVSQLATKSLPKLDGTVLHPRNGPDGLPKAAERFKGKLFAQSKAEKLSYEPFEVQGQNPVPRLANKLDRVLFSPGIHYLKDPRTNVYNFDPRLEKIMSITDFDFRLIPPYVPAGKDSKLSKLANKIGKKYTGSTSSLTPALTQLHHALSHRRPPQILNLSKYFPGTVTSFSATQRAPTNMWLLHNAETNTYSVTMPGDSQELIVTLLGQAMEAMLITECEDFEKWSKHHPQNNEVQQNLEEQSSTYNYTTCGPFLMRSQLDCYDPRLPGTGMFDLKTRASCAVRHDIDYAQIRDGSDYQILKTHGQYQSFAREYYDLVRSAMFKYSLQARIGRMDGIFLAYHSVRRLFGFEYLPLSELDKIYHSSHLLNHASGFKGVPLKNNNGADLEATISEVASLIAEKEFVLSIDMLSKIFDELHKKFPSGEENDLNIVMHCNAPGQLLVFARPGEYGSASDPKLMGEGADADCPSDLRGFKIQFQQTINGVTVPTSSFPAVSKASDSWEVKAKIEALNATDLEARFRETQAQYAYQDLTSEPNTSELPGEEELKNMLARLPEATDLQKVLRKYDEQGANYATWDSQRPKIEL